MAIIQGNAHKSSVSGFYPKTIEGSLRFNSGDQPYISYTNGTATDGKQCTLSFWIKKNEIIGSTTTARFISAYSGTGNQFHSQWGDGSTSPGDQWQVSPGEQSSNQGMRMTDASLRDPSAWYHCVWSYNSTSGSESVVLYVNGVAQTSSTYTGAPTTNLVTSLTKSGTEVKIGYINSSMPDFQLAELFIIDGTAHDADAFGETKNGVWVPKNVTAADFTMGDNGVHLTFQDDAEVEAFNTVLYQGTGATQRITGVGFQPDLVWVKSRTTASHGALFDSVRGSTSILISSLTNAEAVQTDGSIQSFDADGFTLNLDASTGTSNFSGRNYVAWGWKAGDSNVSNTDGSITSTVRANDTYGFSIVSYTGNGTAGATVGHGLSSAPDFVITKRRNSTGNWFATHSSLSSDGKVIYLNLANGEATSTAIWNDTAPDASTFTLGDGNSNNSGGTFIAYCWAEKSGYSKFGSYAGNATSVDLGFNPAFILVKRITGTSKDWWIFDNTREVDGQFGNYLSPNQAYSEQTVATAISVSGNTITFPNNWDSSHDGSASSTYIYAAFADTRDAAFWLDQSSNDNDWQPANLDHNDTVADSPTDNFATLNPLDSYPSAHTFSEGNLRCTHNSGTWRNARTGMRFTSGQWYWEIVYESVSGAGGFGYGVGNELLTNSDNPFTNYSVSYNGISPGTIIQDGTTVNTGTTWTAGDVMGLALDIDAGTVKFYKNNTLVYTATSITGTEFYPIVTASATGATHSVVNFGQQPFKYDPPA